MKHSLWYGTVAFSAVSSPVERSVTPATSGHARSRRCTFFYHILTPSLLARSYLLHLLRLSKAFMEPRGESMRAAPPTLKTPPYVIPTPVVTHRPLSFLPLPSDASTPAPRSALRFLVLATDGLWDELSNEDVVALVGGHLAGLRGTIPKAELAQRVPTTAGSAGVDGKEKAVRSTQRGSWAFEDDNVGTHLIRNALGSGDPEHLQKLVSIPAPHSRRFRDDITVTVVWWEDGREAQAQAERVAVAPGQAGEQAKAKL